MRDINSPQSNRPINRRNDFGYLSVAQPVKTVTPILKPAESSVVAPRATAKQSGLVRKFSGLMRRHRVATRAVLALMALLMLVGLIPGLMEAWRLRPAEYELNSEASTLAGRTVPAYGIKLSFDSEEQAYIYNKDYTAAPSGDTGLVSGPRFSAKFKTSGDKAYTITDVVNNVGITFTPKFDTALPTKDVNRLIYPLRGIDGQKVVTLRAAQIKEDIIINSYQEDSMEFTYDIGLSDGLEARLEKNGDIGVYGVQPQLLGSVSAGTEADQALLDKARKNSKKTHLIFTVPAPFIVEANKQVSDAKAEYRLEGKHLTVRAENLKTASYPLSIDPSIYIETADKLMRGNNETNVDFDIDNELIQKSQTTGARISAWQSTTGMNSNTWNHSTATAGGYIYRAGGRIDPSKPQIVGQQQTLAGSNTGTFTMNMPTTRPAGDLYIAMMCHDGSNGSGTGGSTSGNTISTPSGWTKYADLQGLAAYYKIGTDQGGGNESASYQWTGNSEEWAGVVIRVTGFNSSDPVSGTAGTGFSTTDAVPVYPATTPDSDATLVVRAAGFDQDDPSSTGWVPSGHTKIDSESSSNGGNGSCGFTAASLDVPPASGVSTGTQALTNDATINDDYGAATIAINPATVTAGPTDSVYWAEFNNSTKAIDSPNPGTGACSGWCTDTDYDLPTPLVGHSLVAYNGYLYAVGGRDSSCTVGNGTGVTGTCDTVYISKLGANGEPALWHPTDTNKNNWVYWYRATDLPAERAYTGVVAYNNKMYLMGGADGSNGVSSTTYAADILPNGNLGTWSTTGMQALPTARYGHSVQVYNDVIYLIGGNASYTGTPVATTHYSKLSSTGTMNAWTATTSFANGRQSMGGTMTAIWGGYVYLAGGCTAVNGSGYCTTFEDDTQLASINADGSLAPWNEILGLTNQRVGYTFVAWQGGLYRLGGCTLQNTSTGNCTATLADVDYGVINPDGEASTVASTSASGVSTCIGGTAYNCDIPSSAIGNMLNATVVLNGYLYIMGGCTNNACTTYSDGVTYQAINSNGSLTRPATCNGSFVDSYCDSSVALPSARGAAATAVFNNRIYLIGGFPTITNISYTTVNADGSIGSWSNTDFTDIAVNGIDDDLSYSFAYTRANPASASSIPGNLFIFGGCTGDTSGIGCSSYSDSVYKCDLNTTGVPSNCTITGQLQIGTVTGGSSAGLGAHAGAVYANYIYLMGGLAPGITDLTDVRYARFDDSNNVVAVSGGAWIEGTNEMNTGRRRGAGFGYNGYLYVLGGYDGADAIADIEFAKINVSDGSWGAFDRSTVSIQKRWALTTVVSNSYAYVVGGCTAGAAPGSCSSRTNTIQVFQIYNNDSGAPAAYTSSTTRTQTSIADANTAGNQSSLAIGTDGLPVISYFDDTNDDLAVLKCGNAACTSGNTVTKIADGGGDIWGRETNIAIGTDGYPVIAHWNETDTDLAITKCSNASCSSNTTTKFADADATGRAPSIVIGASGLPIMAYRNTTDTDLMISECTTIDCTALNTIQDSSGNYGPYSDIVLGSDDFPIISHRDSGNSDLAITKCSTANCSSRSTATVAFTSGGFDTSIAIGTDDLPIITSMENSSSEVLKIVKCGNAACSSGNTTTTIDPADNVGRWTSVAIGNDGLPVISYINFTSNDLVVTKCGVASCASGNTTTTFTGAGFDVGIEFTSLAVPADGLPVVSHFDITSNNVAVLKCADASCSQATGSGTNSFTTDRIGAGSAILNGYLYVAGGCTGTTTQTVNSRAECNTATSSVQYALLDAYGNIGTWNSTTALPAARVWGQLVAVGGSLYYLGGLANNGTIHAGSNYAVPNSDGTIPAAGAGTWTTLSGSLGDTASQPGQARMRHAATVWNNRIYVVGGFSSSSDDRNEIFISPSLPTGGDIAADSWTQAVNEFDVDRIDTSVVAYANNLYVLGGYDDGGYYLNDVQFSKIDGTTGDLSAWTFTTSLPGPIAGGDAFAANGYMYLVGGRGSEFDCSPNTLVAPISANTTIASGNNPTGVGEWYETNARYTGDRYGNSVTYSLGRIYAFGGGCQTAPTVSSITTGSDNDQSNTTNNVTMPATVEAGDLLLLLFTNDGSATVTDPDGAGGWTAIDSDANGTAVRGTVYAKEATGSEDGSTVNFATSANERTAWQIYRILDAEWSGDITTAGIDITTTPASATTQNPNPPSLNPANWDIEQTLWIAYTAGSTYTSITSAPSGYGTNTHANTSTSDNTGASASSARLASATSSQDPGTFTMNASQDSVTYTVAIRPAYATLTGDSRVTQSAVYSQPQLAKYSRLIDTDTDVFPTKWLMNGLDNSIGARWQLKYRSMHDLDTLVNPSEDCGDSATMATMTGYGQETNVGDVTLGSPGTYTPVNSSGADINCARYFFFNVSIDASQTFGYPEDVDRGPTLSDLTLFFTADPSKRLRHGKTFTGGEQQPLDTPFP